MVDFIGKRVTINPAPDALPPSGVAEVLSGLAKPFMDTLTPALKQQKLNDMIRENAGVEAVAAEFERAGREGRVFDPTALAAAGVRGGMTPGNTFGYGLGVNANSFGARDPRTTNAAVGAGHPFSGTAAGQDAVLANQRTIQRMAEDTKARLAAEEPTNIFVNGVPTIARRADAYGKPAAVPLGTVQGGFATKAIAQPGGIPALAEPEQKFIGAEPHPDRIFNWVDRDPATGVMSQGTTIGASGIDARTKQPLSPTAQLVSPGNAGGSNAFAQPGATADPIKNKLVQARDEHRQVIDIAGRLKTMAATDPTNVGAPGNIKRGVQELYGAGAGIAQMFGGQDQFNQQFNGATQQLAAKGVQLPGMQFDPNASNIVKLNTILVYKAASALAGQNGRDLSDADVKRAVATVGDPSAWFADSRNYMAGLDLITGESSRAMNTIDQQLKANNIAPGGLGGAPVPAAPAAPGATPPVQGARQAPDGNWYLPDPARPGKYLMVQ